MKPLKVAAIQQACGMDRQANLTHSMALIRQAAEQGAKLIVLQELHTGPYFCQIEDPSYFDWAESIPGPSTQLLGALAQELKVVIVASLFERRAAGIYHNTAAVLEQDGSLAGIYRKMHIPDDPSYYEKFFFTPGDLGFQPIQTSVGKLGVLVCWDQWYPEAARLMALAGADILIYPTAIGGVPDDSLAEQTRQREAWTLAQRAHAVSNALPVIVANRIGFEPHPQVPTQGLQFWGSSFITGPQGEFLAQADQSSETILVAEVDLARTETVRRLWPFFRDRRIDAYSGLLSRYLS